MIVFTEGMKMSTMIGQQNEKRYQENTFCFKVSLT